MRLRTPTRILIAAAWLAGSVAARTQDIAPATLEQALDRSGTLTDLRALGSAPFHLMAHFEASNFPEFNGSGSYDELWMAPGTWRREVSLGAYHALETQSPQGHFLLEPGGYEPAAVRMLLQDLWMRVPEDLSAFTPFTRTINSNGGVVFSRPYGGDPAISKRVQYAFGKNGVLVFASVKGTTTTWTDFTAAGSALVPRSVTATQNGEPRLSAQVHVEPASLASAAPGAFVLDAPPAPAERTLLPVIIGNAVKAPRLRRARDPEYPKQMRGRNGLVVVALLVDQEGNPREINTIQASDPRFAAEAVQAVEHYRFAPATWNGVPVEVPVNVEVRFSPRSP